MSVCVSVCPCVCVSVYLYVCVLCVCLCVCVSVCSSAHRHTPISLYSCSLSGLVLLVDKRLNSYAGIKRGHTLHLQLLMSCVYTMSQKTRRRQIKIIIKQKFFYCQLLAVNLQ